MSCAECFTAILIHLGRIARRRFGYACQDNEFAALYSLLICDWIMKREICSICLKRLHDREKKGAPWCARPTSGSITSYRSCVIIREAHSQPCGRTFYGRHELDTALPL